MTYDLEMVGRGVASVVWTVGYDCVKVDLRSLYSWLSDFDLLSIPDT